MKLNKFFALATLAVTTLFATSCSDGYEYEPAVMDSGAFMYTDATTKVYSPSDDLVINLTVARTDASGAATVTLVSDNPSFQASSVSFNAGEESKTVQIPFTMEVGTTEQVTISIPEGTTQWGYNSLTFNITLDYVWNKLGTGQWLDGFWYGFWANVTIEQRADDPSIFRVTNPYTNALVAAYGEAAGTYTEYLFFNLSNEGQVTWDKFFYFNTLYDEGQEIKAYLPSALNASVADADALSYAEVDEDGSILFFQIAPYWYVDGVGGFGTDYPCYLAFPGVDLATEWEW